VYRVDFSLTGHTAILYHADDVEASDELQAWRKDPSNKKLSVPGDDRSPAWTWITYLYHDGDHLAWPSYNLMVGLRAAGAQMILKRQKTFKEVSQSGITMDSEFLTFTTGGKQLPFKPFADLKASAKNFKAHAEFARAHGFKLFIKRAVVGKAKHVRVRARFDEWAMRGSLTVHAPEITFEILERLFDIAGRGGQGDWRPNCKTPGPFGMFAAELKQAAGRKAG
jgi:hypothetical protein